MSYATADDRSVSDDYPIRKFFEDLKAKVVGYGIRDGPGTAFLDALSIKTGQRWADEIAEGLGKCRVFVPILTDRYFTRPYCGKEWQVFEERCRQEAAGGNPPPLFLPIVWNQPVEVGFPNFATDIQNTIAAPTTWGQIESQRLEDYQQYGLERIYNNREDHYSLVYDHLVDEWARRIVELARQHVLPEMDANKLGNFDQIENRFMETSQAAVAHAPPAASNEVKFAFCTGTPGEMQASRPNAGSFYPSGDQAGWAPFAPDPASPIALSAQRAAMDSELLFDRIEIDDQLIQKLQDAESAHSPAIVVIDPWSVQVQTYRDILLLLDGVHFSNCVFLVVWNVQDEHTEKQRDILEQTLKLALFRKSTQLTQTFFKAAIDSPDQLQVELAQSLRDLEEILATRREPIREVHTGNYPGQPTITPNSDT